MNKINQYLEKVCEQIRFEKAHDSIKKELQDHITDQIDTLMQEGIEEQKAVELAVKEMGDPVLVGTELDRIHRPKCEWSFIVFVCLLTLAHFAMQYVLFRDVFIQTPLWQNGLMLLFSIGIMLLFYRMDFTILAKHGKLYYWLYFALLALCYWFTWTSGYFLSMDLSEPHTAVLGGFTDLYYVVRGTFGNDYPIKLPVLVYVFPVILSGLLYHYRGKAYKELFLCCFSIVPLLFFCYYDLLKAPCRLVIVVSFVLILISIAKNWFAVKKQYAVLLVFAMVGLTLALIKGLYMLDYNHVSNHLYEPMKKIQVLLQSNIKGSCIIGKGKAIFTQDYRGSLVGMFDFLEEFVEYFPAYLLYHGGWLVALPLLAIYFCFMIRGFLLAHRQKSQLGWLTATAILLTFFVISLWNIVANSGLFVIINPLGIPFFTTSDSLNIVFFALMGILLSVFRTGHMTTDQLS